jgi:hypothetical protein
VRARDHDNIAVMSTELVATTTGRTLESFEASLAAEQTTEQRLMRMIAKSIAIGIPLGFLFFMGLLAIAIGDQTEWYVIVGLGAILGVIAAVLFGMLGAVTLIAHTFDNIDRGITDDASH